MSDPIDCPECQAPLGREIAATGRDSDRLPVSGDHGLCVYCLTRVRYYELGSKVAARRMTQEEFEAAPEYAQANMLNSEALARQVRSGTMARASVLVDLLNRVRHAAGELDRAISQALFRLSQAHGKLIEKSGEDEITLELGRIMAILEQAGR